MPERRDWIPAGVYLLRQQNLSLKELDERIAPEPVAGRDDCLIHPSGKVVELTEDGPEELKWRFSPKGEFYVVLQDRTVLWGLKALYEAFIAPVPFCAKITNIDPAQERLRLDNLMVIFDFEAMMEFLEVEGAFDD